MPVKDGFQAAAEMRAIERGQGKRRCRIIAVTAMSGESQRRRGMVECGIDEWRTKPVGIKQLREEVEKVKV
jgi:CheY-like chemotaxis protein